MAIPQLAGAMVSTQSLKPDVPLLTSPAYVLGLGVTGLAASRALSAAGVEVLGFDSERAPPGRFSRHVKGFERVAPETEPLRILDFLLRSASKDRKPVLMPTTDGFLLFVSRYRSELAEAYSFCLPSQRLVEAIVDKRQQFSLASQNGLRCPETLVVDSRQEILEKQDQISYPAILKPAYSHLWWPTFRNKGLIARDLTELEEAFSVVNATEPEVMIQSAIPGPATNHYEVCTHMDRDGTPLAIFTTRKIRQWPIDLGVGTLIESVENVELERLTVDFLRGIGFKGTSAVEFKRDSRSGRFFLIEVNARLWSDLALAVHCGLNFPLLAYLEACGESPQPANKPALGPRWLDAANDSWASWTLWQQGLLKPSNWFKSLSGARAFAFFDALDPLPYLLETGNLPRRFWRHLGKHRVKAAGRFAIGGQTKT